MTAARRLRAEWEPQSAILIAWPHPDSDWCHDIAIVEPLYDRLALEIARRQQLLILARDDALANRIRHRLAAVRVPGDRTCILVTVYDDTWSRDYGPLGADEAGEPALLDFRFNGWGGKFDARRDDGVPDRLHSAGAFNDRPYHHLPWVLEGGAIESDGNGTLLATLHSVVTQSRNPGASRADLEKMLAAQLGIRYFLWLEHGALSGDDTDGHIDTLARFADPETILHITAEKDDPDYPELAHMVDELAALRTRNARPYRLVPLPPAGRHHDERGRRLPATYANFLILNEAILMPLYGVPQDSEALTVLRTVFPGREIVGIDCRALIHQNGSLHCATMQLPVGAFSCPGGQQ